MAFYIAGRGHTYVFPAEAYLEEKYPNIVKISFMGPIYIVQLKYQANNIANNYVINVKGL